MLANAKYIYALDMWTVEKRPNGWYFSKSAYLSIPAIPISRSRRSRSPIPIEPDQCGAGCERAPSDAFLDLSVAFRFQVRREPVHVVNRRDPRATWSAPMRRVAACVGGAC